MSRIGRKQIPLPPGVTISVDGARVTVRGPKGILERTIRPEVCASVSDGALIIELREKTRKSPAYWGLTRALLARMVEGVSVGFEKKLEIEGVGYRASLDGKSLVLALGFSHPVRVDPPDGITFVVEKNTITISGIDIELVGNTAAKIRGLKPPEPYKGKGIHYLGEVIRRKAGKKAVASA